MSKKITVAELNYTSDRIVKNSAVMAVLSVIPAIIEFERESGPFTAAQRDFISRAFKEIAMAAIGLHAQALSELMLKLGTGELELDTSSKEETTGDPEKFEELLKQFGGIKGSA